MNRSTTILPDRIIRPTALRPAERAGSRRSAMLSGVATAVLLGLGAPALAASNCSSTGGTLGADTTNGDLCLSPDSNAATTTNGYATAIGSGTQATTSAQTQGVIDYRTAGDPALTLPNSTAGQPDMVSGTAIGQNTTVGNGGGVGIGYNNTAGTGPTGFFGVAVGANNDASGAYAIAIGQANQATNISAVAMGTANQATGNRAVAIGRQNDATGDQSIAQGFVSSAYGNDSIALGNTAVAGVASSTTTAINDVAIGKGAQATGGSGVALGAGAVTTGAGAIAIGQNTAANTAGIQATVLDFRNPGNYKQINNSAPGTTTFLASGTAIGALSTVGSYGGVALGYNNVAGNASISQPSFAIGATNIANGINSLALGLNNTASNSGAIAIGTDSQATGRRTIAVGREAYATGDYSMAQGYVASAYGTDAIALGNTSVAGVSGGTAVNDVAIGNNAQATGGSSVALGDGAVANGGRAVSIGAGNTATGNGAVAIGDPSTAVGTGAFAGGADNNVYGEGGVGIGNNNTANSAGAPLDGTVALGDGNSAVGQGSVALGFKSTATGAGSLAFGDTASATHAGGVALGSGAVDGAANQSKGTYALGTSGPISLGYDNTSGVNAGTVSVGSGSGSNAYRQAQNVADGSASHDAVNVEQLASVASQANAASNLAVQYTPDSNGNPTTAVDLTRGGTVGNGGNVSLTGLAPATTSTGAVALGQMPLQYSTAANPTTANPGTASNDATLVGSQSGTVGLHNIGPGSLASNSTDAVNGAQLNAAGTSMASNFGGGATYSTTTGAISAPSYTIRGTTYNDVGSAFGGVDGSLGTLQAKAGAFSSDNTSGAANAVSSGHDALAGGFGSSATGAGSAVLGNGATDSGNAGSTVLGMHASIASNTPGSNVALGQGAVASSGAASNYSAFGLQPAQTAIGEVSVGASGAARRITNLAAGRDANDAVDVAQLQGTASNLGTATAAALGGGSQYSSSTGGVSAPSYTIRGTAYGDAGSAFGAVDGSLGALQAKAGGFSSDNSAGAANAAATGQNATAGGFGSSAAGAGSAVLGNGATDNGNAGSTVLGMHASIASNTPGSNVALGQGAVASSGAASNYSAFGLQPAQSAIGEVSVGASGAARRLTNLAAGRDANDAVDVAQLQGTASNLGTATAAALGGGSQYSSSTGGVSAPSYTIRGTAYGDAGSAFGAVDGSLGTLQAASGAFSSDNTSGAANAVSSGHDALAGGFGSSATGAGSAVLGNGATDSGNAGSTVLGMHASIASNTPGSNVALGQGAVASSGAASNYSAFGLQPAQTAIGEVSVGASGAARRLTNLAAGRDANDAVDVAQLQGTASNLGTATAAALGGGSQYSSSTGGVSAPSYTIRGTAYGDAGSAFGAVDGSLGTLQAASGAFSSDNTSGAANAVSSGKDALAGGFGSSAAGAGSTVLGNGATDNGNAGSTVLGMHASIASNTPGSNVALGQGAVASSGAASNYSAFGLQPAQSAIGEVSVGSSGAARRITNLAAGRDANDAVDVAQLQGAVGSIPVQYSTAANPTTANPGAASNDVTLVGAQAGAVSLHNLAAGKLAAGSTDAVNGAQLYAGATTIASAFGGGAAYDTATGKLTAPAYTIAGKSYADVGGALGALDGAVNDGGGIKYFHANSALADSSATGTDSLAAGGGALASAADATALGANASSTGANSVALGAGSTDGGLANVVSVGAVGSERRIVNVAAGTLAQGSTDAATAGQVFAGGSSIASALGGGATYDPATGRVTSPAYTVNGAGYATVGGAIGALDGAVSGGAGIKYFHANSTLADSSASGRNAVAVGPAALASGAGAVALGSGAAGTGTNSVALGAGSTDGGVANVVSVGSAGAERRIVNVAAGTLAAGSTDAATAGQVFAGGSSVASILGGGAVYNAATGAVTAPSYAIGGSSYGTVGGALAALDGSVNGGGGIKYFHANSTLADATATGTDAVAMGPAATASGTSAVAIGNGASSFGKNSVALGAGSTDGGQDDVVSVGAVGAERRITNVATGALAQGSTDAVNGGQLYQTNQQVAALGHTAVQYDTGADGRTLNSVSLSSDAGGPVVIHNLGAGTAATDAANVGQLRAATANGVQYDTQGGVRTNTVSFAGGQPGAVTLQNVGPGVNGTDAVNVNQLNAAAGSALGQAQGYTDARINNLAALTEQQISQARSDAAAGTASALAASGLRYDDRPGKTAVAGAASYYHGQAGLAFGLGHTADDGHVRLNAAVTVSPTMAKPEVGAVVGGSWSFN